MALLLSLLSLLLLLVLMKMMVMMLVLVPVLLLPLAFFWQPPPLHRLAGPGSLDDLTKT